MAMYLRGNVWWFEIRTPTRRVRKSTGFTRADKKKAEAVYHAALVGMQVRPPQNAVKEMLEAIYGQTRRSTTVAEMWPIYTDWFSGKMKQVAEKTMRMRKSRFDAFASYADANHAVLAEHVTVDFARQYVATMGGANKTIRMRVADLSLVWDAVAEMVPGIHNPWKAAMPSNDGSSRRRDIFSDDERDRVLEAARKIGSDWYGVCLTALWTGQRYGDVATLEWGKFDEAKERQALEHGVVDVDARMIVLDPSKTRRHGTRICIPMVDELAEHLSTIRRESGFVFPGHASHYLQPTQMHPPFSSVLEAARVTDGYHDFHSFRHTLRSMLSDARVPQAVANLFGGWTSARMGSHYDHSTHADDMRAALEAVKNKRTTP